MPYDAQAPDPRASRIHVVGAGIAGMIAALRLLQQDYSVTVYEASAEIGGKFGAVKGKHDIYHEHAYHIFADWCLNFFGLCREIGLDQDEHFEAFPEFHVLRPFTEKTDSATLPRGRRPEDLKTLRYFGSPEYFWTNVNSEVADWQDMLLFGYSVLDLLTDQRLEREEFLNRVSVNGYVRSLPYASDMTGLLHQDMLLKVFASPSYETSARTYQTYLEFTAGTPFPHPPFRALKGNCQLQFWRRFEKTLEPYRTAGKFRLERQRSLTRIEMHRRRVTRLWFEDFLRAPNDVTLGPDDHVIVAIPADRLYTVARNSRELLRTAPDLLGLGQLQTVRFAALDLYFTEPLTLPSGHVTLMDDPDKLLVVDSQEAKNGIASQYGLSFIDNGRFWPEEDWQKGDRGKHFLGVLVGDYGSLTELDTTLDPKKLRDDDNAPGQIIKDLRKYIYFRNEDVDWERSHFRSQKDTPLFVNSVGSWEYRPETRLGKDDRKRDRKFKRLEESTENLHLAGDYCRSRIDVVSVEAALVTGITAARAICGKVPSALEPRAPDQAQIERAKGVLSGWVDIAAARARARAKAVRKPDTGR